MKTLYYSIIVILLVSVFSSSSLVLAQHVPFTLTQSPLKQLKSGIDAKYVVCKEGLQLIIKAEDGSPACVYASHAAQLLIRGWAESENQKTNLQNTVKVTGSDSSVTYDITGGKLLGIITDAPGKRLFIPIQSDSDGKVKLTLPRSVIDTNPDYKNDAFYIITNSGSIGIFNETDTTTERTITIPFEKGDNIIQISVMSWLREIASIGLRLNSPVNNTSHGQGHIINIVESGCENEFKPKPFEIKVLPNGTSVTINYTPVFLMKPNSTGKICINNWRIAPEMNYSGKVITGIGKGDSSVPQDVIVVADPDTITMDGANKTIVYTITASKDAVGFYMFSPMFSDCGGIPIAVGYDSTHLFDNDFPWMWETVPCPLPVASTEVTGLTGIDVAYITKEYQ